MNLKLDSYRWIIPSFHRIVERDKEKGIPAVVSEVSASTGVPSLALIMYAIEIYGESEDLLRSKNILIDFYNYNKIEE